MSEALLVLDRANRKLHRSDCPVLFVAAKGELEPFAGLELAQARGLTLCLCAQTLTMRLAATFVEELTRTAAGGSVPVAQTTVANIERIASIFEELLKRWRDDAVLAATVETDSPRS